MAIDFDFSTAVDEEEERKRRAALQIEAATSKEDIIPLEPVAARPGGTPAPTPQLETEPGTSFATEESEAHNQGRGPNFVEPVTSDFDFSSAKDEEPSEFDFSTAQTSAHSVGIVTAYRPGGDASMGLSRTMEGGNVDAHGEPILGRTTVEDYQAGNGDYITVAMDKASSWQNQFLSSPNFPGMVFRVRDNGGYGNNKTGENWIDVAFSDPQKAKSMMLRGVPFTPISADEAQKISESRPELKHTPKLRALAVPGGSFSYEEPTGLPDPFVEVTARTVRGAETGTREMFGGALSATEAGLRGERNIYLDEEEPEETAQSDIPRLEEQIATLKKELHDRTLKEDPSSANWAQYTTFDSPEIGKLDKQLKDARRAAAGDLRENVLGSLSRQTERLASEAEKNQVEAMKKYQPYISQARDTKWGYQLAGVLGQSVPGVLASIGNPIFGATAIYAQIYQSSMQQYMAEKPEATREQAQKFANDQALAQVPWAIAGNQLTARALKASFATLPAGAVERGARVFGTQVGQAVAKNAQAFIGNVGSAIGQSMMSDMVSEDYDLLEDTDLGQKFTRSLEPASLAGGVSLIFGGAGMAGALAKRPGAKPKAEPAPKEVPTVEITIGPKALPAPKGKAETAPEPAAEVSIVAEETPPAAKEKAPEGKIDTTKPHMRVPGDRSPIREGDWMSGPTGEYYQVLRNGEWGWEPGERPPEAAKPAEKKAAPETQLSIVAPETGTELARYGPLAPGQARPAYEPTGKPPELPPSTSIVPAPKGIKGVVSIIPILQNPLLRRHINYTPGQSKGFWKAWSPIRQWQRMFIGAAEVFEKTPGLEGLGKSLRNYVDDKAMFKGRDAEPFRKWEKSVNARDKGIAHQDFHRFFLQANDPDVNVQKQAIPTYWAASPKGRELIDLTRDYLNRTGIENQAMGIVVFDPVTGNFRPIGKVAGGGDPIPPGWYPGWKPGYFPRMIAKNEMDIINDPNGNPAAYEALKDKIEAMGFPRDSIDAHLSTLRDKATSNEFFASLDLARTAKLPQTSFDYSFETMRRYLSARSERLSQIKNFGQVKAHAGPESLTLFDDYLKNVPMDAYTRKYVERIRNHVLNIQTTPEPLALLARQAGTVLTGIHLGNPRTAMRNLFSGQAMIGTQYGFRRWAKGVLDAHKNIDEAHEKGIIVDDLMNLMEKSEGLGPAQKFTNWALKWSGESPAENFNRAVNMVAAKSLLRDALDAYKTDPFSRKSLEYFGHFKRMGGIDPQALIDEGGSGPLTDRYLRQSVRYVQGGYQVDQVPAFQNTDQARFFLKYTKWGTQQTDFFSKEVVRPAIRELTFGKYKKETVEVRNPVTGKMETKEVPGDLSKAVGYFVLLAAAGGASVAVDQYAFGLEDKTESLTEILRTADRDQQEAFFDALGKLFQYQLIMGVGGSLAQPAQAGFDWTQKVRFKDPLNPPIPELLKDSFQLFADGMPNGRQFDEYLRRNVSAYRTAKQTSAYFGNDVFPLGFRELKRESMLQDLKWLRGVTQRYEKEQKVAAPSPWKPGAGSTSPMSRFNYNIKEALLMGDVAGAKQLMDQRFATLTKSQRDSAMDSLMDSVRAGRPIKIGGSTSEAATAGFLRWADANMSKSDAAKLRRMDETYRKTAIAAGILKPGKGAPTLKEEEESLRQKQMRTELREQE